MLLARRTLGGRGWNRPVHSGSCRSGEREPVLSLPVGPCAPAALGRRREEEEEEGGRRRKRREVALRHPAADRRPAGVTRSRGFYSAGGPSRRRRCEQAALGGGLGGRAGPCVGGAGSVGRGEILPPSRSAPEGTARLKRSAAATREFKGVVPTVPRPLPSPARPGLPPPPLLLLLLLPPSGPSASP